jgi:hypothetical protein
MYSFRTALREKMKKKYEDLIYELLDARWWCNLLAPKTPDEGKKLWKDDLVASSIL